jgi:hypothetical protein
MSIYDDEKERLAPKTILLAAFTSVMAATFIGFFAYAQSKSIDLGPDLCPVGAGPILQTVILIDMSDPLSLKQSEALDGLVDSLNFPPPPDANEQIIGKFRFVEEGEKLVVYVMRPLADKVTEPIFLLCNPGNPDLWGPFEFLIKGLVPAKKKFATFRNTLVEAIESVPVSDAQSTSPIMEWISVLAERHVPTEVKLNPNSFDPTRLIIFSDMIQNSAALSHFEELPDWPDLARKPSFPTISADLTGVEVDVIYLRREKYSQTQTPGHFAWWPEVFVRMGGRVVFVDPK